MWFTFLPMGEPLTDAPLNDAQTASRAGTAGPARSAVVRPLARAAQRRCARPGCPAPASATLRFDYARRDAWIDPLLDDPEPQSYDLCGTHVGRTHAPYGWRLRDRRSEGDRLEDAPPATPADLGGERTIAVLAAALRAVSVTAPESGDERTPRVTQIPRHGAGAAPAADEPVHDQHVAPSERDATARDNTEGATADPAPILGAAPIPAPALAADGTGAAEASRWIDEVAEVVAGGSGYARDW
jgi:hypothetical protein